ncbi:tRNA modification GTPase GTPBP3, mitochondrial [Gryllus bimaculatus]|nr:tRNA modification GTPase GTPBP3, mitochondrial [Gryllus bimaculatus]
MIGFQTTRFFNLPWLSSLYSTHCRVAHKSTIYALSSGYGKCGVAVIRVSGPKASEVIFNIGGMNILPQPRFAKLCKLRDPETKEILDKGLLMWFPGEFTRRAFDFGKLDLTEVEGLGDLLSAETEAQRKQAYLQMEGSLSNLYNSWRQTLIKCVAHLEAFIDFSEDENIEDNIMVLVNNILNELEKEIQEHVHQSKCGERLREGVRTVIIGEPNVGKSSLLNILCNRPAAIVTPIAGTTRDIVELHMNIGGYPVLLADTAGLRSETKDEVEIEGMTRAKSAAKSSDLILFVIDGADCVHKMDQNKINFENFIHNYLVSLRMQDFADILVKDVLVKKNKVSKSIKEEAHYHQNFKSCLVILNKYDLVDNHTVINEVAVNYHNVVNISCKTKEGMSTLQTKLESHLKDLCGNPTRERPNFTQARHRHHLSFCLTSINDYFSIYNNNGDLVLAAQKLRNALRHIGKITGHVNAEQILDVIFKDFCIGK